MNKLTNYWLRQELEELKELQGALMDPSSGITQEEFQNLAERVEKCELLVGIIGKLVDDLWEMLTETSDKETNE